MNYLAHVAVADASEDARLGALLGDFAKGLDEARLPQSVRQGLDEHREVDVWFDALPEVRTARAWFDPNLRRFSGILIDVFVDHFLVRHWRELCPPHLDGADLADVTESLYRSFDRHAALLPPRLVQVAPSMVRQDWLGSYGDPRNVLRALHGLERRFRRPTPIASGIEVLHGRRDDFEALTRAVVPKVAAWTRAKRDERYSASK